MDPPTPNRAPIVPERVRAINGQSFAFLPHRFLRDGFLSSVSPDELRLYLFLVLAADRSGISFYSYERICSLLEIDADHYIQARNGLIDKNLLAFDGARFQILSLPAKPVWHRSRALRTARQMETSDPATVRQIVLGSFPDVAGRK
jgi:hypothetical protein